MRVWYATVLYADPYFRHYVEQSLPIFSHFVGEGARLVFINDGAPTEDVAFLSEQLKHAGIQFFCWESPNHATVAQVRGFMLEKALNRSADLLVLFDFDNVDDPSRLRKLQQTAGNHAIVCNDFRIVDNRLHPLIGDTFYGLNHIDAGDLALQTLDRSNICGWGAMALDLRLFDFSRIAIPNDIQAVDWFVAAYVLLNNGRCYVLKEPLTLYRQHQRSFIGYGRGLNEEILSKGLAVKEAHYRHLCAISEQAAQRYRPLLEEVNRLKDFLSEPQHISRYIKRANTGNKDIGAGWWGNILSLDEMGLERENRTNE